MKIHTKALLLTFLLLLVFAIVAASFILWPRALFILFAAIIVFASIVSIYGWLRYMLEQD